jgi:hypothetical protein
MKMSNLHFGIDLWDEDGLAVIDRIDIMTFSRTK